MAVGTTGQPGPPPELDDRKSAVLLAVVRAYVREGEPVGSKRVVDEAGLGVSAATVRNDMVVLEDAGYIMHPHTSAGRVPTDKGYRYFVDALRGQVSDDPDVSGEQIAVLDDLMDGATDLEDLLRRATTALSRLTRYAGLVAAPQLDQSRLKHIELVQLSPATVLVVSIADTGRVSKRMVELAEPVPEVDVHRVRHAVNGAAAGLRGLEAPDAIAGLSAGAPSELTELIERTADAVRSGIADPETRSTGLYVGGSSTLAGEGQFAGIEEVRQVYETLEEQVVVMQVLKDALADTDPGVRIGAELSLSELQACAIVATSYDTPSDSAGQVGVLGPSRMDYRATLGAVRAVADTLERAIAGMTGTSSPSPTTAASQTSAHPSTEAGPNSNAHRA
ncbi:heat-inducible transcriptional repressor HrcA [Euzebya tangerina]|uniref:heat-inducible transcriptional repressor HrcA n=1 Tax=Euzebya tangerina TaxID=591198 RepID=UPI0013C2B9C4|nr:heat-inducible transcriptional repressor HrcA [Euzebya tangerina]